LEISGIRDRLRKRLTEDWVGVSTREENGTPLLALNDFEPSARAQLKLNQQGGIL
jgi:hypothetical protein